MKSTINNKLKKHISITINTSDSAFEDEPFELTDLIRTIVDRMDATDLMTHDTDLSILDTNEKLVGRLLVTDNMPDLPSK